MKTSAVIATLALASGVAAQMDLQSLMIYDQFRSRDYYNGRRSGGLLGGNAISTLALTGGLGGLGLGGAAGGALDLTTLVALDQFGNAQYYGRNAFGELLPLAALTGGAVGGLNLQQLTTMYALDEASSGSGALGGALPALALTGGLGGLPTSPLTTAWALGGLGGGSRSYYAAAPAPVRTSRFGGYGRAAPVSYGSYGRTPVSYGAPMMGYAPRTIRYAN